MNENQPETSTKISPLVEFLLKDTVSLRNEIHFIKDISELVHPLAFSWNSKKYPSLALIPVLDKKNETLKEIFLNTFV